MERKKVLDDQKSDVLTVTGFDILNSEGEYWTFFEVKDGNEQVVASVLRSERVGNAVRLLGEINTLMCEITTEETDPVKVGEPAFPGQVRRMWSGNLVGILESR